MMLYEFYEGNRAEVELLPDAPEEGRQYLGFFEYAQASRALERFGFGNRGLGAVEGGSMLLENHQGYDFMRLYIPNHRSAFAREKILAYRKENVLFFVCEQGALLERVRHALLEEGKDSLSFDRLLYAFFERLMIFDISFFDKLEQEIAGVEDALIETQKRNFVQEITSLRKRIMPLKRHYEQLLDLLDELQENENGLFNESGLRYFHVFSGKVERHYHNILNLRDYVTQVREAYQSEVDIDLNNIMKIFTVITAIFLPLSLIVGWYGMNLHMPELNWPYAYPMVIALSMAVVIVGLAYFKKKKWF